MNWHPFFSINGSTRTAVKDLIQLARPHQYLKNVFVFLPLIFGYQLFNPEAVAFSLLTFINFCFAASAVYVFNDIQDINEDRSHPIKCMRPLAGGRITCQAAFWFGGILAICTLGIGLVLAAYSFFYIFILTLYLFLNVAYSIKLKHFALIDVVIVSVGFVLRVFAGGLAIGIMPSHWLVLMTFLLALFISLAKRRDDLLLASSGNSARKSLDGYGFEFVSGAMMVMAAVSIVSYILYTLSPDVTQKHGTDQLYLTTFWVIIGFLRYMQITFVAENSGSPTQVFLGDRFLQAVVLLWLLNFIVLIYVVGL